MAAFRKAHVKFWLVCLGTVAGAAFYSLSSSGAPIAIRGAQAPDPLVVYARFLGVGPQYGIDHDEKAQAKAHLHRLEWETYHSRQPFPAMGIGNRHAQRP